MKKSGSMISMSKITINHMNQYINDSDNSGKSLLSASPMGYANYLKRPSCIFLQTPVPCLINVNSVLT